MTRPLAEVVAEVLGVSPDRLSDETTPDDLPEWTSLAHINLILTLEREYGIALTPEDAVDMLSFGLIRTVLAEQGVGGV